MKYIIEITETLQKQVVIEADNEDQAKSMARVMYRTQSIILNEDNLKEVTFERVYCINGSIYTIEQLREKYREKTLKNDKGLSDELIYTFMLALSEVE